MNVPGYKCVTQVEDLRSLIFCTGGHKRRPINLIPIISVANRQSCSDPHPLSVETVLVLLRGILAYRKHARSKAG